MKRRMTDGRITTIISGAFILYIFSGIWFGSLSYNIRQNPSTYTYMTRFAFYPLSTALKEGWICNMNKLDGTYCIISTKWNSEERVDMDMIGILKYVSLSSEYARLIYVAAMAIGWPLKVVLNIVLIILLFLLPTLFFIFRLIFFLFALFTGLIVTGFVKFLLLL